MSLLSLRTTNTGCPRSGCEAEDEKIKRGTLRYYVYRPDVMSSAAARSQVRVITVEPGLLRQKTLVKAPLVPPQAPLAAVETDLVPHQTSVHVSDGSTWFDQGLVFMTVAIPDPP